MFAHSNSETFEDAEWIIIGIPSELGSLSKSKNYMNGPDALREGSYRVFESVFSSISNKKIFDYGDLELDDIKELDKLYNVIYTKIKEIFRYNKKYFFIGGDHSITYPILKLFKEKYPDLKILYFDAHPDCHPDPYPNYQSFMYYLLEKKIVDYKDVIYVGVNDWSEEEKKYLKEKDILYFTPYEIWKNTEKVKETVYSVLKGENVYITIDIDVFDTGCGHWLTPFGIRLYHFFEIVKDLNINLKGFDIVELFPSEFCENLSAKIAVELMALF